MHIGRNVNKVPCEILRKVEDDIEFNQYKLPFSVTKKGHFKYFLLSFPITVKLQKKNNKSILKTSKCILYLINLLS